jgi:hypothetical protein
MTVTRLRVIPLLAKCPDQVNYPRLSINVRGSCRLVSGVSVVHHRPKSMPFRGGTGDKHSVAVHLHTQTCVRYSSMLIVKKDSFPTSARRRIASEDQIFIIISPLFADNPHT